MSQSWFEVDRKGLSRILKRRGLRFIAFELVANAWDSKATQVTVTLEHDVNKRLASLVVEDDDPNGFEDITHAYTMFADSLRRANPEQRGRFNVGEKLALAAAKQARIVTTTAGFRFDDDGRHRILQRTTQGSKVEITFSATKADMDDILQGMSQLIPPIPTTLNGQRLDAPTPVTSFETSLETVLPDEDGNLKSHTRKTTVEVYQNGHSMLYEMGIPVVDTGDTYSYNVLQKVPLNLDRDNVPPRFLRTLRVMALNELHEKLDSEAANQTWVRDALTDERVSTEAVKDAIKQRFGDKVVAFDPRDLEANKRAVAEGYVVVHGRELSSKEWENIKRDDLLKPAGQVTPSPKAFSNDPNARPLNPPIPPENYTEGMRQVVEYANRLAKALIGKRITVEIVNDFGWWPSACYGKHEHYGELTINKAKTGNIFFEQGISDKVVALLIHELAHDVHSDHLSGGYNHTLCDFGAKMRNLKHLEDGL